MTIYQVMPGFALGDAVSNQAFAIRQILKQLGYQSEILAQHIELEAVEIAMKYQSGILQSDDILLYHHSIGFDYLQDMIDFIGHKALIYHNITPKDFFESYDPVFAQMLAVGRQGLSDLADKFSMAYADSQFNVDELNLCGFKKATVLPLLIDPLQSNIQADALMLEKLTDGKKNILFTGRLAPNKKQTDLIHLMPYLLEINPDIRLCLVGDKGSHVYFQEVESLIRDLGLQSVVWLTGKLTNSELKACFLSADLYFSPSEHEGFGVPLIESMCYKIPVLAYKSTAIPETLSSAGLMITNKKNYAYLAELVNILLEDSHLREKIILAQNQVCLAYNLDNLKPIYQQMIKDLIHG